MAVPLENWPIDELIIELAQSLAASRAASRIYDKVVAELGHLAAAAIAGFTNHERLDCWHYSIDLWRAILDKGGVIPDRLRQQYAEIHYHKPEAMLSGREATEIDRREYAAFLKSTQN